MPRSLTSAALKEGNVVDLVAGRMRPRRVLHREVIGANYRRQAYGNMANDG